MKVAAPTVNKTPHNFSANGAKFFGLISVKFFGVYTPNFDEPFTEFGAISYKLAAPTANKTPHNFSANGAKFFGLISVKFFGIYHLYPEFR